MRNFFGLGFSLIELMIVIAIIAILVSISLPTYQKYTRRAHYVELVQAASPYQIGVEECFQMTGSLIECNSGKNSVPDAVSNKNEKILVKTIDVTQGIITLIPKKKFGITSLDSFVLTPEESDGILIWKHSGGGVDAGYAN